MYKLGKPCGYQVLVRIVEPKTAKSMIAMPAEYAKNEHNSTQIGRVLALGPLAFKDADRGLKQPGDWGLSEDAVGDYVQFKRYAGLTPAEVEYDEEFFKHYLYVPDDQIGAVLNPETVEALGLSDG